MIYILHYLKGPKLWELWSIPHMGNAGFIPSTEGSSNPQHPHRPAVQLTGDSWLGKGRTTRPAWALPHDVQMVLQVCGDAGRCIAGGLCIPSLTSLNPEAVKRQPSIRNRQSCVQILCNPYNTHTRPILGPCWIQFYIFVIIKPNKD